METKTCYTCKLVKPAAEMIHQKDKLHLAKGLCKTCAAAATKRRRAENPELKVRARLSHVARTYGITVESYLAMMKSQDNVCAICKKPETMTLKGTLQALAVDHCHVTGKVRALLCANCNRAIGSLKHDRNLCLAAADYLTCHK